MKILVEQVSPEVWATVSEGTHFEVFGTYKPKEWDRIDYALFAVKEGEKLPVGYMTCREISNDAVYWQFGGSFKEIRGTTSSWRCYQAFVDWTKERYKCVHTYTENGNLPYLKMALKAGFKIVGTRAWENKVYLDLILDFRGEQ